MSFNLTIDKAIRIAGSQEKLAEIMGVKQSNISAFRKGTRAMGYKKKAQIAAIAGEDATAVILESLAEDLDEAIPHEAEAKRRILAILTAPTHP